jgi:hypothetical protein
MENDVYSACKSGFISEKKNSKERWRVTTLELNGRKTFWGLFVSIVGCTKYCLVDFHEFEP